MHRNKILNHILKDNTFVPIFIISNL